MTTCSSQVKHCAAGSWPTTSTVPATLFRHKASPQLSPVQHRPVHKQAFTCTSHSREPSTRATRWPIPMARGKGLSLDLLEQLTFYGSYHHNRWNQLIHFVFVPSIIWSIMVGLAYIGPLLPLAPEHLQFLPALVRYAVVLNAPCLVAAMYSVFYICLEPFAGVSWAVCMGLPLWLTSTAFQMKVADAWAWALGVQVFSWYMQIHPGHGILEKRKPALLDSLVQAFALAPLFVWFELLFALGYRPQLYAQLQLRVQKNIAEWRAKHLLQAPLLDEGTRQE